MFSSPIITLDEAFQKHNGYFSGQVALLAIFIDGLESIDNQHAPNHKNVCTVLTASVIYPEGK